ncbi:MAG: type II toxin-antitoxin system RelE/ParE family toxin [Desulfobaccales bacterium]
MIERTKEVWRVEIHDRLEKKLARLARRERENILEALEKLQGDPFVLDLKSLHGRTDWRLRVGAWRVLLRMDADAKVIIVYDLGTRRDIYK